MSNKAKAGLRARFLSATQLNSPPKIEFSMTAAKLCAFNLISFLMVLTYMVLFNESTNWQPWFKVVALIHIVGFLLIAMAGVHYSMNELSEKNPFTLRKWLVNLGNLTWLVLGIASTTWMVFEMWIK